LALRTDFLLVVLGRVVTALIAVASLRIMTTLLEPSDYGQWAMLMAFQTFCGLFLINPVDQHVFRHAHAWWDNGTLLSHFAKFEQYLKLVSLIITVVVMLWWNRGQGSEHSNYLVALFAGIAVGAIVYLGTWSMLLVTFLNVLGFRVQSVIFAIVGSTVGLICSILFVSQYTYAISWILGQAVGAAVAALGAWHVLKKHASIANIICKKMTFSNFLDRKTILSFCLPLAAATGFMWLQNSGYRFLVNEVWGAAELGFLVIGLSVSAQLTALIETLAMQFLYPYFVRRLTDAESDAQIGVALSDLMNVLAPIYAIWAGFNAVCAAALLEVLTDARYHVAVPFVIFGAMIEFTRCITNLWSNTARAVRQTRGLIVPYALGAAVVWFGAIVVAHFKMNLIDFSFVLVFAGIVTCAVMIIAMLRLLPITVDVTRWAGGLSIMCMCFAIASATTIRADGLFQSIAILALAGVVSGFFIMALLWRNPALSRLLSVSLRTK
jgi:O-antigen/teichoic acid export membrane protein